VAQGLTGRLALAFVGGCIGGALRIVLGLLWHDGGGIPWTLLTINLLGSLLIGIVGVLWGGHPGWWPLLGPGVLGGFTTFSGIAAMTWTTSASLATSLVVLAATLVLCSLGARLGVRVGERVRGAQ
jgi:CrcB protein